MLKLFVCFVAGLLVVQNSRAFYVASVGVNTKYDSDYILSLANQIVPPDKRVNDDDINCLRSEFKASGIFEDIQLKLVSTGNEGVYQLVITPTYVTQIENLVISEIEFAGMAEIDKKAFWTELNKRGISRGDSLWKYPFRELKEEIGAALRKVYPQNLDEEEIEIEAPWITIVRVGPRDVKLILSPVYSGC